GTGEVFVDSALHLYLDGAVGRRCDRVHKHSKTTKNTRCSVYRIFKTLDVGLNQIKQCTFIGTASRGIRRFSRPLGATCKPA
ncbi:MAG: hypothetical protein LC106_07045, partial [Burkholderiales bacterium]|nr:hypothetical protein [Burkholderiales bacterium]